MVVPINKCRVLQLYTMQLVVVPISRCRVLQLYTMQLVVVPINRCRVLICNVVDGRIHQ